MKTTSFKALLILVGSLLISGNLSAGVGDQLSHSVSDELSHFHIQGLYVIGGIIVAGLLIYLLVNHFGKEEGKPFVRNRSNYAHNRRAQQRAIVKRTA